MKTKPRPITTDNYEASLATSLVFRESKAKAQERREREEKAMQDRWRDLVSAAEARSSEAMR